MKSDFILAFNQICNDRGLSGEVVLDALQMAMVSAYRRDSEVNMNQNVTAEINLETGKARIFVEKQVVEKVTDPDLEISLADARVIQPDAKVEGVVMIDSTPKILAVSQRRAPSRSFCNASARRNGTRGTCTTSSRKGRSSTARYRASNLRQ